MQKITPFLWYSGNVEEAVDFYTSIFKSSKVISRNPMGATVELEGQQLNLFNGGPLFPFTEAISLYVNCDTQDEIDYYWEALTSNGGQESRCGWLKDKFGLSWQIVPSVLGTLLWDKDRKKADAAMQAMLKMVKLDIKALQQAHNNA
jgi:predicted 3-demethylubiquinone-9 3-methyltransferase (glyoxalase superfamily)